MAAAWLKSFHCKSTAFQDVLHPISIPKHPLLPSPSCRNSSQNLKDVLHNPKPKPTKSHPHPNPAHKRHPPSQPRRSDSVKPNPKPNTSNHRVRRTTSAPTAKSPHDPFFPSVSELQVGHPSRNVVEIIFHTRWGPEGFSGRVETVLKIHNMPRTVSQFEQYRDVVRARAGSAGRDSADGNEMMRFRCLGPTSSSGVVIHGDCGDVAGKGSVSASNCTYSGSGVAHESAGGGRGRRSMLVCRVIAGRVKKRAGVEDEPVDYEFDSVSGENGELLVFDNRAVLPCFLVIYKL